MRTTEKRLRVLEKDQDLNVRLVYLRENETLEDAAARSLRDEPAGDRQIAPLYFQDLRRLFSGDKARINLKSLGTYDLERILEDVKVRLAAVLEG